MAYASRNRWFGYYEPLDWVTFHEMNYRWKSAIFANNHDNRSVEKIENMKIKIFFFRIFNKILTEIWFQTFSNKNDIVRGKINEGLQKTLSRGKGNNFKD